MSYMTTDYNLPEEATPCRWYEIYRATNDRKEDQFDELKSFMHWCEVQGVTGMTLAKAAIAIELFG